MSSGPPRLPDDDAMLAGWRRAVARDRARYAAPPCTCACHEWSYSCSRCPSACRLFAIGMAARLGRLLSFLEVLERRGQA